MTKMRKPITVLLVMTIMLASVLSGCGKSGKSDGAKVNLNATQTTGEVNAYGWEMPKETIKMDVFLRCSPALTI